MCEKNPSDSTIVQETKVYRRRYYMLFLFSFYSFLCGMLFPQYVSLASINMCYYKIPMNTLNWTVYMFMISYCCFVLPVSFIMNHFGLRWTVIAGAICNTTACALQFLGLKSGGFPFILLSTAFSSASNLLVLAVPPFLAAIWFPSSELSRACAAGVFGNQLGIAAGYLFSPLMTPNNCSETAAIEEGKFNATTILTAVNLFWTLLIILSFQDSPKCPPTKLQVKKVSAKTFAKSSFKMLKSIDFINLLILYGMMVGSYFAVTTILNNLVLLYFPHKEREIGWMGSLFIVAGLGGSMIAGTLLDYTHRFKETTLVICFLSLITYAMFCCLLAVGKLWVTFLTLGICGFFLTSFLSVGLEYGIELTFPEPEIISASILTASTNLFGLMLTEIISFLLDKVGAKSANAAISLFILVSFVLAIFLPTKYKRSENFSESTANLTDDSVENKQEIKY